MAEPSVDPLVPHLFLLSLTPVLSPSSLPSPPPLVFELDGVDESHAVRDVAFGRPSLTLVMLAMPGWCHVP